MNTKYFTTGRITGKTSRTLSALVAVLVLAGCNQLPPCVNSAVPSKAGSPAAAAGKAIPKPAQELLVGIDGSGSMLGHTRAANTKPWEAMLQAIKSEATGNLGLSVKTYRIGGGSAQELPNNSATAAKDPCFFQGCGTYTSVASSLQTLWDVSGTGKTTPLRLLVSDLEVNDQDITSLIATIKKDVSKGASVGVLALKLPFSGEVFNAGARNIFTGSLNRPVYLLATGNAQQVQALLNGIREKMSLNGVGTQAQEISLIDSRNPQQTLLAQSISFDHGNGKEAGRLKLQDRTYNWGRNTEYQFAEITPTPLNPLKINLSSTAAWAGGTRPRNLALARLERIPLSPGDSTSPEGIQVTNLSVAGSQLRLELQIPPDSTPGAIRAIVPAGSLPEAWWIEWNRDHPAATDAKGKTDGLLPLMITLSQQVRAAPNAPPAAVFCIAFNFQKK